MDASMQDVPSLFTAHKILAKEVLIEQHDTAKIRQMGFLMCHAPALLDTGYLLITIGARGVLKEKQTVQTLYPASASQAIT
jgi:hypothetical protein